MTPVLEIVFGWFFQISCVKIGIQKRRNSRFWRMRKKVDQMS